jgi:archaellum component FlaC
MAQMEWELEDRVRQIKWSVEHHTQQLDSFGEMLDDMERGGKISNRNMRHQIERLEDQVRELSVQVRNLMGWEPWLLRV